MSSQCVKLVPLGESWLSELAVSTQCVELVLLIEFAECTRSVFSVCGICSAGRVC